MRTVKIQNLKVGSTFRFSAKSLEGIYVQNDSSDRSHVRIDNAFRLHGPGEAGGVAALNDTEFTVLRNGASCMRVSFNRYNSKKGRWQEAEATIRTDRLPPGTKINRV